MRPQFYEDNTRPPGQRWRWRLVAGNGKIVADSGEGYRTREDCEAGFGLFKLDAPGARVRHLDREGRGGKGPEFEAYEDESKHTDQRWRWRFQGRNNKTLADGGEGYDSRSNLERAIERVQEILREMDEPDVGSPGSGGSGSGGYTPPSAPSEPGRGRFG